MDRGIAAGPHEYLQRQYSDGSAPSSPAHPLSMAAGSFVSRGKRAPGAAAANARLAQMMMRKKPDYDAYDDDEPFDAPIPAIVGGEGGWSNRSGSPMLGSGGGASAVARNPSPMLGRNIVEPAAASRSASTGRAPLSVRTAPMVPPVKTTIRTPSPIPAIEPPVERRGGKRYFPEMGRMNPRDSGDGREASALQDKLDMLEEENYSLLEKLQFAEERCKEAEDRSRELEKQVANLGEGVSLEARLLSRKEAALRQREEAMKAAMRTKDEEGEELTGLREQVQSARDEAESIVEQLKDAELEVKALRSMTQRMVLTPEEMEEVSLKRCWLARYWGLAVQHGIYPDISAAKHEYWSSLASLPLEVVTSAGQKAKDESWSNAYGDSDWRNKLGSELSDITTEGSIENMLAVEKGLRELVSLKVEDAVVLALAEHRRPNLLRQSSSDFKSPGDPKFLEAFELSQEEVDDVLFKQSWLAYFWRRAKRHGIEEDIAEEHLQFWTDCIGKSPTSHDAVDVERGLIELRKLGIEQQLWEASRRDLDANQMPPVDEENSQLA